MGGTASSACCGERSDDFQWSAGAHRREDPPPIAPAFTPRGKQAAGGGMVGEEDAMSNPAVLISPAPVQAQPQQAQQSTPQKQEEPSYLINSRKASWRLTPAKDMVGVGAYFETLSSGSVRVRGLAKAGPAEQSQLISIGDELLTVDDTKVHGRPLSELGQFILGPPGSTVHLRFSSRVEGQEYDVYLARGKPAVIPTSGPLAHQPLGEVNNALRL